MRLRSLLFAPASRAELVDKLPRSAPDGVILDLEDGVAAGQKEQARAQLAPAVSRLRELSPDLVVLVRVNGPSSPWFEGDLEAVPADAGGIVLPKLERPAQADRAAEAGRLVIGGIESAAAVEAASELCRPPLAFVYFGAEDFVADMGGVRTKAGLEVLYARSRVTVASRVGGIAAIDQIVADFNDDDAFRADAAQARALGFVGKLCIHPRQVRLANEAFTPTAAEVDRARRLVAAYEEGAIRGLGAINFEGEMVDLPVLRRAEALLERA